MPLLIVFAALSLSWRAQWARWVCAGIGALVMGIPFLFWTTNPAAYLSDTLVGALIFGFAVCTRPEPGPSPVAALTGPEVPPGWTYNPSAWTQRIADHRAGTGRPLRLPLSGGLSTGPDRRRVGTVLRGRRGRSAERHRGDHHPSVSEAWPVSDAAVGGYTYMLEILTGIVGSRMRWRTMPWLVILFGLMIAPLGITSIFFIIIQPIVIGTWSTLALIAAAAVLVQIPYSLDELLATLQFMRRRVEAGRSWLRVFLFGDTDEGEAAGAPVDEFDRGPVSIVKEMVTGGVGLPWNLVLSAVIGLWLLFTRVTLGLGGRHGESRPPDRIAGAYGHLSGGSGGRATAALPEYPARVPRCC